ncbi:hypothetical protein ISN44_As08g033490 [Arabidopsis suecica]|uniref:Uncharacterized protein n=1 Tax=Arabidopsis suecica TaxID=45249 RepID=A0A8T2BCY8_ARASU|nr:hypothetical protein ISN44_As08g033490 [Arabidopsis suecica]
MVGMMRSGDNGGLHGGEKQVEEEDDGSADRPTLLFLPIPNQIVPLFVVITMAITKGGACSPRSESSCSRSEQSAELRSSKRPMQSDPKYSEIAVQSWSCNVGAAEERHSCNVGVVEEQKEEEKKVS